MIFITSSKTLQEQVKLAWDRLIGQFDTDATNALKELQKVTDLTGKVKELQGQVSLLTIQKSQKEEEFARKEREIEHKIGLERNRQAQEVALAKREATIELKEIALKQDRQRFEDQMKFHQDRFMEEVKYQRELSEKLLAMLPKMTIKQEIK